MKKIFAMPQIIGFEIPTIASWTPDARRLVVAHLSVTPPVEWQKAFDAELARASEIIKMAALQLSADRINFLALPTNIGSLRRELRHFVAQINHRAAKSRRKSQRAKKVG